MADIPDPATILALPPRRRGIALKAVKFRDAVRLFEQTGKAAFRAVEALVPGAGEGQVRAALRAAQRHDEAGRLLEAVVHEDERDLLADLRSAVAGCLIRAAVRAAQAPAQDQR